ncbi:MAG TPA: hypothetical protein VK688_04030, partial [Gemmatimonadales bacterium]|nr:hypothetical protein [Gemmatimonadales bacterium]
MPMFASMRRGSPAAAVLAPALALGWAMWACAPASTAPPAGPPAPAPVAPTAPESPRLAAPSGPDPCLVRSAGPLGADTIRVIAGSAFAPRQLYQTLIRLDCSGIPRPDLAQSWASSDGGRTWGFRLASGHFWDNVPLTGETIAQGWAQDSIASKLLREAGIIFVTPGTDADLRILLARPQDSVPLVLADPRLAIVRRSADSAWPVGTGPYRLPETDPAPATLEPVGAGAPIRLLRPPADLRDAVDAGADLIVTDDPGAVGYASGRPDFTVLALPWGRAYVLVLSTPPASTASLETA